MHRLWLLAPVLALGLLGVHFYREGSMPLVAACVAAIGLLAWPQPWAARAVQLALAAGTLEWLWTTLLLVHSRIALGRPWSRLALILSMVALLTALAALVFRRTALRAYYRLG